jgi:starch-binding outer membrane protein, SusD/RagB family
MMKKISYLFVCLIIVITAGSCKKFLTEKPLTQIPTADYFKSIKDVNAAMAGMYGSFQDEMIGDGLGFNGNYFYWGEGRSDNFDRSGYPNTTITELSLNQLTSGNSSANWTGLYRTIGRANTNITYIPQAQQYDNTVTNNIINNSQAQCYAMRAICYFYIVRVWGDAPIWTEPYQDINKEAAKARSSKEKIMDSVIIPDLQKAYSLIQKNQTPIVWNINEAAIAAMLADVYLWRKDYPNTIDWIKKVFIAKGSKGAVLSGTSGANLEPGASWKSLFLNPTSTNEAIWSLNWDYTFNGCACLPVSKGLSNNPVKVDSVIHNDWKFAASDIRVKWSIDTLNGTNHDDKILKYYDVTGNSIPVNSPAANTYNTYLVMYRLGDVYLSYAEALNKTGDMAGALKYLNFIRVRAGLPALLPTDPSIASMDQMEDVILGERQRELFAEGKRWFDLVRTNHINKVMDPIIKIRQLRYGSSPDGFGSDQNKILWPLHRNLLEYNKKLVQNPSYN